MRKAIALLHRYPKDRIKETNAAFSYLDKYCDTLTFKSFDRLGKIGKLWQSFFWVFYAPTLVFGKGYEVIYCDDSFPFYPALVKMASPRSRVFIRLGDLHLMYHTHGLLYKILHFFEKIGWLLADGIIVISEPMAGYIYSEIGRLPHIVLDPVEIKDFTPGEGNGSVMFHGTLTKNKNVDVLIEAAKLLPEIDFVVVGDGPDLKRLQSLAPKNVFFDGWVPFKDIPKKIAECSVGVALRSDNPGNQFVVTSPFLQYGVMGKPCLVTRRRVFENYPWQFEGPRDMADKIKTLLNNPNEGKKLRDYIIQNHDAEKIGDQICKILMYR